VALYRRSGFHRGAGPAAGGAGKIDGTACHRSGVDPLRWPPWLSFAPAGASAAVPANGCLRRPTSSGPCDGQSLAMSPACPLYGTGLGWRRLGRRWDAVGQRGFSGGKRSGAAGGKPVAVFIAGSGSGGPSALAHGTVAVVSQRSPFAGSAGLPPSRCQRGTAQGGASVVGGQYQQSTYQQHGTT